MVLYDCILFTRRPIVHRESQNVHSILDYNSEFLGEFIHVL